MFYSNLYKKYYPFKSPSDILSLGEEERAILIKYIRKYPPRAADAIHKAWNCGCNVERYPIPARKIFRESFISSNKRLGDIVVELHQRCKELLDKINKEELVTDKDVDDINLILYSNKYCSLLTWFAFPTPGRRRKRKVKE